MKNFWKKNKLQLSICIYLAMAILIYIVVVMPLILRIKEISNETQKMIVDEEINRSKISKLSDMREIHEAIRRNEDNFNIMIDSSQEVGFIKKLEALAESTGNKIEIKIDESNAGENSSKNTKSSKAKLAEDIMNILPHDRYLLIQLSLEGNYQGLMEFIYKLENFDYYVNVVSISLMKDVKERAREVSNDIFSSSSALDKKNTNGTENILKSNIALVAYIKKK